MEERTRRYVGIDLGKREYTMAIIELSGKMSFSQGKTSREGGEHLYGRLRAGDRIALEAGNLAFIFAREITQRVGSEVRVLNAGKPPFIWDSPTKTDKEDAMKLAHLVEERRDEKLPIAPVPSQKEMEARKVCASYAREQKNRTRHINTQHALFVRQGHTRVVRKDLSTAARREKAAEVLRGHEREEARWILKYLELHEQRLAELKKRIYEEANKDEDMRRLQTVPGVGPLVAYAYAAHVGDGSRFSSGSQVSNYLGLIPCLDYSGTIQRQGHISKRGNGYIRALLLRAAWMSVRSKKGGALRLRYEYMTQRRGLSKKKSAIAITRRLAELLYALMRNKSGYEPRLGDISHWPLVS